MRSLLLIILFLWTVVVEGQNSGSPKMAAFSTDIAIDKSIDARYCTSSFQTIPLGSSQPSEVQDYLKNNSENLKSKNCSLRLLNVVESKTGVHLLFQQLYDTIPVYRAQIKVNMDKQGNIKSVFDNTFVTTAIPSEVFPSSEIINIYLNRIGTTEATKVERNYYFYKDKLIPVVRIEFTKKNLDYYEVIIGAKGEILYLKDLNLYYRTKQVQDSIVSALIFLPDPLTTAGNLYKKPYIDAKDSDVVELNAQRTSVNIKVDFTNDTFRLQSPYAIIKEFSDPVTIPAFCADTPNFNYTRSQQEFEDVNAYYHINTFQEHIRSLGFTNLADYQVWIDTHTQSGADNSMFSSGTTPPRLAFGEGGVDDAEDADVIVHEYTHAISFSAAPNTTSGPERSALEEANADYFASSYSRSINSFYWEYVFSWDGHNEFWAGRKSVSNKHYPENLAYHLYYDADIWSSTIMEIWGDIGRNRTDEILLESMYSYATGMKMTDAATLFVLADSSLNNGLYNVPICNRLFNRGLSKSCDPNKNNSSNIDSMHYETIQIRYSLDSLNNFNYPKAYIFSNLPVTATIQFIDIQGRIVYTEDNVSIIEKYEINRNLFAKGMYILRIKTSSGYTNLKFSNF